jgi:uncharacterized protein YcnI
VKRLSWAATGVLTVLAARSLAYALSPSPLAVELAGQVGGPTPVAVAATALLVGAGLAATIVWLATLGVEERRRLSGASDVAPIRLSCLLGRAAALFLASVAGFALLESSLQWRAGLGWHGLHCLVGPVHRNAVPILAALALVAAALAGAAEHVIRWVRRSLAGAASATSPPPLRQPTLAGPQCPRRAGAAVPLGARGPPYRSHDLSDPPTRRLQMKRSIIAIAAAIGALAAVPGASAHSHISPPVALADEEQVFQILVPTEGEHSTTRVEVTPREGFRIESVVPVDGWKIDVEKSGTGEDVEITKITWSGGSVADGEAAVFPVVGSTNGAGTFSAAVKQVYDDGQVSNWSGPESADEPAAFVEAKSSLGGGGGTTLTIVALIVGAVGVLLGGAALLAGRGGRELA